MKRARYKDEKGIDRECFAKWARRKDNEKGIITPQARILRFLSKMGIQGIPRVLDFVETVYGKRIILFEKFPEGGTLDEKIEALSKEEVVDIMLKVTRIVESLLAEGVYHWDIKPDNIWVTNKGEVILFDFDLAFMGKDEFTDRKLYFCGDPKFMSKRRRDIMFGPTSFLHEKVPFVPADEIFSLGRSLEVLLSERRPPDLQSLIDKACAGRYETIDEFRIDLEKVAVSMAASNKPIEMIVDAHRAGSNI
ncbi:MAG: hypothetical protein Q8N76_03740 [Candidatus Omnitrophota bacterium]|nr:hypothetical protein [Candidatus Omnitrophota bacterium]